MADLTSIERAAWDATGHDQSSWGAVRRALAAAGPLIAAEVAERLWRTADEAASVHDGRTAAGRAARGVAHAIAVAERGYYDAAQQVQEQEITAEVGNLLGGLAERMRADGLIGDGTGLEG